MTETTARTRSRAAGARRSRVVREWLPVGLLTVVAFVAYAAYSVSRYRQFLTAGHDLGIFDQALHAYAHFRVPTVAIKGVDYNILGDHFHPILVTIVPAYWVYDDPRTLLVVQAALLAASIPVVYRIAHRRMPTGSALVLVAGYALGWPLARMVDFDFHEVAFAVPLLALALDALDRRSDRALLISSVLLLLVREDLGAVVLMLGLLRAARRPRRVGVLLAVLGAVTVVVVTVWVIPAMSSRGQYVYFSFDGLGPDLQTAVGAVAADPTLLLRTLVTPSVKLATLAWLLVPLLLLPLGSPYALVAVPLVAERFLSARPALWGTEFHYSAPIWVILVIAAIDSGGRWGVWRRVWLRRVVVGWVLGTQVLLIANGTSPLHRLVDGSAWDLSARMRDQAHAVSLVPAGVCVSVDDRLAPQLVRTNRVALPGVDQPEPDYVIVDLTKRTPGYPARLSSEVLADTLAAGYEQIFVGSGIHVLRAPQVTPRDECRP